MGCCIGFSILAGAPRFGLAMLWLFTDRLTIAFSSFWIGLVGFLLLPFTTIFYALAYAPIRGVSGIGWAFVVLGLILDIGTYTGGRRSQENYRTA
ncbi:MAG: hypothetical protein MUE36_15790 [Acidimicrobiales bacterium]|jgi:hypothetical protein|nr:hypothetical protein [Acidimicrobiales bacterium]